MPVGRRYPAHPGLVGPGQRAQLFDDRSQAATRRGTVEPSPERCTVVLTGLRTVLIRASSVSRSTMSSVTSATGVWLVAAAVFAVANWWSRWSQHRPTELWSKPLTLVALIGAAIALDPTDPAVRAWFVVALVLSLVGDVFLLGDDSLVRAGVGRVSRRPPRLRGGVRARRAVAMVVLRAGVDRAWSPSRSRSAGASSRARSNVAPALRVPVASYLGVISLMVAAAAAAGNAWAIAGAVLFLTSDTILGWRQFVAAAAVDAGDDHGHLPPGSGGAGDLADLSCAGRSGRSSRRRGVRTRHGPGRCRRPTRTRCTSRRSPRTTGRRSRRPSSGSGRRSPPD